jgi:hypothetical protein
MDQWAKEYQKLFQDMLPKMYVFYMMGKFFPEHNEKERLYLERQITKHYGEIPNFTVTKINLEDIT